MLIQYLPLLILLLLAILMGIFVVILGTIFGPRRPSHQKAQPYESGMKPFGPGRRRISVRFYLIAVLFILFDIEVIFILPWAVVFRSLSTPGLWLMITFIIVLEVAYVYAWKKGAFEWE